MARSCLALLPLVSVVAATRNASIKSLFAGSLSPGTEIFLPSDANYSQSVTQRWDIFTEPTYLGAIKPATDEDVQSIIRIASKHAIPFLATGGGHGTSSTLGRLRQGIDIDLGKFDSVYLDADRNLLTVGGATVFSQVIDPLYGAGKEIRVGNLQGLHGLLIDSLVSVRLITAAGKIVTASNEENAELLWGIRGAGYNFGIVTSATYRIYDATNRGQVVNGDFLYPASANQSVWQVLHSYDETLPAQMALTAFVLPNATSRNPLVAVNAIFYGTEAQAKAHLDPFLAIQPILSNVSSVPWNKQLDAAFFGATNGACVRRNRVNIYSLALKQTDVATWTAHFDALAEFYLQYPEYQGRFLAERYPTQAVLAVPEDGTAYAYRQAKIQLNLEGWYNDSRLDGAVTAFLESSRVKFQQSSGFAELSVYTGYAHGDEGPVGWYSQGKLSRLARLKQQWDPRQLFSWNNPIPQR
ncbi:MAG: hypothetical protein L6R36_004894 [Xanthoria steineri]|nr:MAG: hypothetical protein L6R36_004894 [Xanthoria steineri]